MQLRADNKRVSFEQDRLTNLNADVQTQQLDQAGSDSSIHMRYADHEESEFIAEDNDNNNTYDADINAMPDDMNVQPAQQSNPSLSSNLPSQQEGANKSDSIDNNTDPTSIVADQPPHSPDKSAKDRAPKPSPKPKGPIIVQEHTRPTRSSERERVRHDYAKLSSKGWDAADSFLYSSIAFINYLSLKRALE